MDVLQISFDELDDKDKKIFLDIACFFADYDEDYVKEIIDFCRFHPENGLRVLVDKSLIRFEFGKIYMHGLLRDLGRYIVREESPKEPRKWNRLWDYKDLHEVMLDNKPHKLIEMSLPESNMKQLWEDKKIPNLGEAINLERLNLKGCTLLRKIDASIGLLRKLAFLNLKDCTSLIKLQFFGEALYLETLNLEGCTQLRKIDPSIGLLRKLTILNLKDCKNLVSLPSIILGLNSLEYLSLSGCSKMYNIVI
ncbi:hypothetical protein JHK87_033669 [Glycine soja]|nr:hypothetical protein JHK87_033669 [Glycine soja]